MSKWRENVSDLGFLGSGVRLAARVLTGFFAGLYVTDRTTAGLRWFISTPLGTDLSGNVVLWPDFAGGLPFPYTLPVEGDV